ncbi:MAG: hypothetical protein Q8K91_01700 [Hylemonella sp.]|nr:hypothetical protein [Hylemonella sp.]
MSLPTPNGRNGPCSPARPRLAPPWRRAGALLCTLLLGACAGPRAYDEGTALLRNGQTDAGLARLEEAVRLDPRNAEYRIGLAVERAAVLQRLQAQAEQARRDDRGADAERAYRELLRLDPNHAMAQQGLALLAQETRHRSLVAEADALYAQGGVAQAGAALDRLRAVLAAEPRHRAALRLKERIDDAVTREQTAQGGLSERFRRPITLQFNDAPLRSIFDAISRISGLNFVFDRDVRPDARGTLLAQSTTVEDAVRLLLLTNQLEQKVLGDSSVLVYPNTPQKNKEYQTLVVRSFFLANADVKAVSNAIKTIVKTRDLVVDERLGTILMRDTADAVRVAERIVALQDVADPEVMLEVEVLEIKRSRLQELGLQWPGQLSLSPLGGAGGSTTLADLRNLSSATTRAVLGGAAINANRQDQNANILTNPRIRVRNKEKAKILIGDRIPVITTTTSGTASFLSESVAYVDVGLKLDVEPTVYLDDEVAIKLGLEVSSLVREVISKNGTLTYQIGTRGANTVLRLKDGETQVLAGLINDEERAAGNKIPGLGELPMLGRLFGSQKDDEQRSEILLSITPRVLRSLQRPPLSIAEFDAGTENAVGAAPLRLRAAVPEPRVAAPAAATTTPAATLPATPPTAAAPALLPAPGVTAGVAGFAALPAQTVNTAARLSWQAPAQVRSGQVFNVLLRGSGTASWRELTLDIAFDPQALQLTEVRAGAHFDPSDGSGSVLQQGDSSKGLLRLTLARPANAADAAAPPAAGPRGPASDLLILGFKALREGGASSLRVQRADAQPASEVGPLLPAELRLRLLP